MYKLLLVSFLFLKTATLIDISYYEVLGLSKQASTQEIKQAYKKLAIKLHPDKTSDSADQERFIKITEAYETLKDTEKRRQYDLYGSFDAYTKKYDYHSQTEYNNLFYNGLYHNDPFVETLSGRTFHSFLNEGFHFINFYSPFCPPCQNLVEHWKKLAEVYKGIIKVGAVNCKYHNSFCYNAMRIGSYPSLLFYPNGMDSNYVYYRGERTYEALEQFVLAYLNSRVHIPIVGFVKSKDRPMAYVLGANRIERAALTRIAYLLNGIVNVVIVEDENVREKLSKNEETTVVFKYNEINIEIESTEEKELLKNIVESLPKIDLIGPEKLKDIRNGLRSGSRTPWVIYFSKKGSDRLLLYQMRVAFPDMYFGEIDCVVWSELCASLQVERRPAWAVLKRGGAYQRAPAADPGHFVRTAAHATNLHSLSASDLTRILEGDAGTWVMLVVPYQMAWEHILDSFTQASFEYVGSDDISFGIVTCTASTDQLCRRLAPENADVVVQSGRRRHAYRGQMDLQHLKEFLRLIIDGEDLELDEQQVLEILDPAGRSHSWLVAYLPAHCRLCDELAHQWRLVADKLRPLQSVRVGVLRCAGAGGFCGNVRAPVARLYPLAAGQHYSVSLEQLSAAPYILEWALQHLDDSVQPLGWASFTKSVAADELRPTSGKKPWLIYFHSPRCYRCYEMYADFAIAAIHLHNAVNVGKVNCVTERGLCQHEQIGRYPALRLYLGRTPRQAFSSVVTLQVRDYASLLRDIKPHLKKYDESILDGIEDLGIRGQGFHIKHDEF